MLIDKKFRLVIADLGFAIQLKKEAEYGEQLYEQYVYRNRMVGSEDYNAPEISEDLVVNSSDIGIE